MRIKEFHIFVVARLIAVVVKPIFLWLLIYQNFDYAANTVSLLFLTLGSVMVIFNNEAHFEFYKYLFKGESINLRGFQKEEKIYFERFVYHLYLFSFVVWGLTYLIVQDWYLSFVFFLIILLDKFFDEIQRILQFKKHFLEWSKLFLIKSLLPFILASLTLVIFADEQLVVNVYLAAMIVIGIAIPFFAVERRGFRLLLQVHLEMNIAAFRDYISIYITKLFKNQLQSFSTKNVPMLDRLLVRFLMPSYLPAISFLSQLGSISLMLIDYFLISHRRKVYLNEKIGIFDIVKTSKLVLSFLLAFGTYIAIVLIGNGLGFFDEIKLNLSLVIVIGCNYAIFAISQHFNQFTFWRADRKFTLGIDFLFFILNLILIYFLTNLPLIQSIIISIFITHLIRLSLLIKLSIQYSR